jgi:hypothetical protein
MKKIGITKKDIAQLCKIHARLDAIRERHMDLTWMISRGNSNSVLAREHAGLDYDLYGAIEGVGAAIKRYELLKTE